MEIKKYTVDIFNCDFILATSKEVFDTLENEMGLTECTKEKLSDSKDNNKGVCCRYIIDDKIIIIIGVFDNKLKTLVHESMHAVTKMLLSKGIDLRTYDGNEIAAYTQEKIFCEFNKGMTR